MRRGGQKQGGRVWFNRGDAKSIYDEEEVDSALEKAKYPPLQRPANAFARLNKRQKAVGDVLDIETVEREVLKCLNESTTRRLYQPCDQVPLATQKEFRNKFTQELFKCYPSLFPQALMQTRPTAQSKLTRAQKQELEEQKRKRQLRLTYEKCCQEDAATKQVALKKTAAMLSSPWTQSQKINGVVYVSFEDNGVVEAAGATGQDEQDGAGAKKEKATNSKKDKTGTEERLSEVEEAEIEDSQLSELVYVPEEEYGGGNDEDDFGAVANDDY